MPVADEYIIEFQISCAVEFFYTLQPGYNIVMTVLFFHHSVVSNWVGSQVGIKHDCSCFVSNRNSFPGLLPVFFTIVSVLMHEWDKCWVSKRTLWDHLAENLCAWKMLSLWLTADIMTCHSRKSTCVPNNTNDSSIQFRYSSMWFPTWGSQGRPCKMISMGKRQK